MIHQIKGPIIHKEPGFCVIEAGGGGYGIAITTAAFEALPDVEQEARVFTHLYVREDQLALYGFASPREREAFEVLLSASGIGPRVAIAMLSAMPVERLAHAIVSGDLTALSRIPGIGKKKAERLFVELKSKMVRFAAEAPAGEATIAGTFAGASGASAEAIEALISLGASVLEARRRVEEAVRLKGASAGVEILVATALRSAHK